LVDLFELKTMNLPNGNSPTGIGEHWTPKYFHLLSP